MLSTLIGRHVECITIVSVACGYLNLHEGLRHPFVIAQNKEKVINGTSLKTIDERQHQLLVLN